MHHQRTVSHCKKVVMRGGLAILITRNEIRVDFLAEKQGAAEITTMYSSGMSPLLNPFAFCVSVNVWFQKSLNLSVRTVHTLV